MGSFAIVNTAANAFLVPVYDRMPVILGAENWPPSLGETAADPEQPRALLVPYLAKDMVVWPVGRGVGNVKTNDALLIEPIARAEG